MRESLPVASPSRNVSSSHAAPPASNGTPLTGNKGAAAALRAKLLGRGNATGAASPSAGEEPPAKRRREVGYFMNDKIEHFTSFVSEV